MYARTHTISVCVVRTLGAHRPIVSWRRSVLLASLRSRGGAGMWGLGLLLGPWGLARLGQYRLVLGLLLGLWRGFEGAR